MKLLNILVILALLFAEAAFGQSISITGPNRAAMLEGEIYRIAWTASGVTSVSVVADGERTPLGTESRGSFSYTIAESVPARQRSVEWTVPWIDSVKFTIRVKGYNSAGQQVTETKRRYGFRPATLANRMADGIYLDLSSRENQRLYVQKNYRIIEAYISSSSHSYNWRPSGSHIPSPHDHAGVFSVLTKSRLHWSTLFNVEMPYAMRYHGGHFIHATSPNLYKYLGQPASSGCNRLTLHDARKLYHSTPIGTRVEVIGPGG